MRRLLCVLVMASPAVAQTVVDDSDQKLDLQDSRAMIRAVLDGLDSPSAYFYSLRYKQTDAGEDRDVICGIVGGGGEYGFYYTVSEDEVTFIPREMGAGGRDLLLQELTAIGCPPT